MQAHNLNIFYTDDDADDREMFREALSEVSNAYILTEACDGQELMQLLENPPPIPGLIFLDLNMPNKNGYQVLREMRAQDMLKDYPVVVFSTATSDEAISKTRQLGASMYVPKPRSYHGIRQVIETCVSINWERHSTAIDNYLLLAV